ncbi:MAG: nicotinate phosphoribosyltransferase [Desulfovibrio sp.]|nr:nicotinate phosphoribosyltransferase [Desulfovibrio sp.]
MRSIIRHFTDDDLYKFTMCCAVIDNFPRAMVKYTFKDRNETVYPSGFARELTEQFRALEELRVTEEEIEFMKRRCDYIPYWFYCYLKGYRYDASLVKARQDCDGRLFIDYEGLWADTILLEVKILAIISELYYIMTGQERNFDLGVLERKSRDKAARLIDGGCVFSDFGTRRRASFDAQNAAIAGLASSGASGPGRFAGTSNVYFAMKYDLMPVGTMAHEFIAAIGGMFGPQMANHLAMKYWSSTYRGSLGTFLYDTFGWEIFSLNFSKDYANMFRGLRVDSGDNSDELRKIVEKYKSLGIDSRSKLVVFSNALTVDEALEIQKYAAARCIPSYGIGTHFTNDFDGVDALNIVIKLVAAKITESWPFYNETCKLSEDPSKSMGDQATIRRFCEALHIPYNVREGD